MTSRPLPVMIATAMAMTAALMSMCRPEPISIAPNPSMKTVAESAKINHHDIIKRSKRAVAAGVGRLGTRIGRFSHS